MISQVATGEAWLTGRHSKSWAITYIASSAQKFKNHLIFLWL